MTDPTDANRAAAREIVALPREHNPLSSHGWCVHCEPPCARLMLECEHCVAAILARHRDERSYILGYAEGCKASIELHKPICDKKDERLAELERENAELRQALTDQADSLHAARREAQADASAEGHRAGLREAAGIAEELQGEWTEVENAAAYDIASRIRERAAEEDHNG